jgi:hypothetical protein
MWQKYVISKDSPDGKLQIREYAVLEPMPRYSEIQDTREEDYALLCEENYDARTIAAAIGEGRRTLIAALRTASLYPISNHAEVIADSVMEMYRSEGEASAELLFDDADLLE